MKIAISTLVTPARKSGVGNYVINLLNALQRIDRKNEYYIYIGQDTKHLFCLNTTNFHSVYLPFSHDPRWLMRPLYYAWQNSIMYLSLKRYDVDILHLPNLTPLALRFVPTVVTIPDLAHFSLAKYSRARQWYREMVPHLISNNADRIITISESAKHDIVKITGCSPSKIDVTYLASTFAVCSEATIASTVLSKYGIKGRYILYVGNALPHKNLPRVLQAFAEIASQFPDIHLVLVGIVRSQAPIELINEIEEAELEGRVSFVGYVPEQELPLFYKGASVFVFPSLYEGFGLPVLEAMTCNVPVVTSNVSSLPEVAGNAALLVDPTDSQKIAKAIRSILNDRVLSVELGRKGQKQVQSFSWENCAKETLAIYERTVAGDIKQAHDQR